MYSNLVYMTLLVYHYHIVNTCKKNPGIEQNNCAQFFGRPLAHRFPLRVCKTIDLNVREGPAILGQGDVDTSEHLRLWERAAILWQNVWKNIQIELGSYLGCIHEISNLPGFNLILWCIYIYIIYIYIYIYHAACVSIRVFLCCVVAQVCAVWEKNLQVIIPCLVQLSPSCLDSTDICSLWGTSFPCKTPLHNWIQSMKPFARIPQAATG